GREGRRRIPGAGDAVSRCDRVRVAVRWPLGHHQDASQRRGAATERPVEADRAVARALQGRGAPGRPRARPAGRDRGPAPVPGAGPRHPRPRARDRRAARSAASRDAIYIEEIRAAGLYDQIWQAFVVLLPIKSVGVMGDFRTYDHVVALRAVTSRDGMTADWYPFAPEVLGRISSRIINEVKGVNRV